MSQLKLFKFNFSALGGSNEIQLYAKDLQIASATKDLLLQDLSNLEQHYSRYKSESLISKINAAAGKNERCLVDQETAALLDYTKVCWQQSAGLFDITSGVLRKVWDFKAKKIPSQQELSAILPLVGWNKIIWQKPYCSLSVPGMELDFGGIAKEFAADRLAGLAIQNDIKHGLINLGGDIRIIGPHPDASAWTIGITHPREKGAVIANITLPYGGLATSGDYERYFELDGKRYCHILNPKTGWPVDSFQSVSVVAENCLVAGTAATTTMLLGQEKGMKYLKDLKVKFLCVNKEGKITRS